MVPIFASLHPFWLLFLASFRELLGFNCGCTRTSSPHFWGCLLIKPTCKASIRHLHIHRTFSRPVFPQTFYLCLYDSLQTFHVLPRIFPVIISLWLISCDFIFIYGHVMNLESVFQSTSTFTHIWYILYNKWQWQYDNNCNRSSILVPILPVRWGFMMMEYINFVKFQFLCHT